MISSWHGIIPLYYWPFVKGIHRSPVDSHHKRPVMQTFDDYFHISWTNKLSCWWFEILLMSTMVSQITSLTIVYSTIYSGTDERKHQSSVSQAFVRGIHWWPVNSPHKDPVTWKIFSFDDVIMPWWLLMWCCSNALSKWWHFHFRASHNKDAQGPHFFRFCSGQASIDFIHTLQGYFIGIGAIFASMWCLQAPVI